MQVVQEPVGPCEVSLQIDVESDKVAGAVKQAYSEFAQYITVPGFRKGKAPLKFVKQRVPSERLRERAAELLVEPAYLAAVKQEDLQPFAPPKLELVELKTEAPEEAFRFKAIVPLPPRVTLGEYSGLEAERRRFEINDEAVEDRLKSIQDRAAEYTDVTGRAVELGDSLRVTIAVTPEGLEPAEPRSSTINVGDTDNLEGIDEQLIGMTVGEQKTFTLSYPDNYPEATLAGKSAVFEIEIESIRLKNVPALDEEFAKTYGKVDTIEEFRRNIRTELEKSTLEMAQDRLESELVDKVIASSTVEFPPVLREQEINENIREFLEDLKRRNVNLDYYLEQTGQTQEALLKEFESRATRRIERGLVLGEIAKKENLFVTDEDVTNEIAERAASQGTTPQVMQAIIDANKQADQVRNRAQAKKILTFLTASAVISDKVVPIGQIDAPAEEPVAEGVDSEALAAVA